MTNIFLEAMKVVVAEKKKMIKSKKNFKML